MALTQFQEMAPFGDPMETRGLERAGVAIDGFGLLSYGLIWPDPGIWVLSTYTPFGGASLTTSWTNSIGGVWGYY